MSLWFVAILVSVASGCGLAIGLLFGDRLRQIRKETLEWFSEWNEARKAADLAADLRAHRAQGPLP